MQYRPVSGSKAAWPFAAICCLGLVLFLIAAMIVIALIPVYLSSNSVAATNNGLQANSPLYLQYSAAADESSSLSGSVQNLDSVAKQMNLPSDVTIESGVASSGGVSRRRRGLQNRRKKRDLTVTFLFICKFISTRCNQQCLRTRQKFLSDVQTTQTFSSINIQIDPGSEFTNSSLNHTYTYQLAFVGFSRAKPSGFLGAAPSATFVIIASGDFTDPSIWADGRLPYGPCNIVIPSGFTVTIARPGLRIRVKSISVAGTLVLGVGSPTFQFTNPISIRCLGGGKIQDSTTNKRFLLPQGSIVTVYPNGGFTSAGTVLQSYSPVGLGSSFTVVSPSGPLTCAILPNGNLLSYSKVVFIAFRSGAFSAASVYLGGFAPLASDCSSAACGLYLASGVTVSTAELGGQLAMNIDTMTISSGATLQLGTPGSSNGFKFRYPITINALGTFAFVAGGGGIFMPGGSAINLMAGGRFSSLVSTFLQIFDPATGLSIGSAFSLSSSTSGPFFITITIVGGITTSIIGPGGTVTTAPVTVAFG